MASNSAPTVDRIRIIPRPDDFLDRNFGNSGEVFFDKETKTLRLFDGKLQGGYSVVTDENITKLLETTGVSREEAEEFAASQQTQLEPMTAARSLAPLETTQSRIAWGPQN